MRPTREQKELELAIQYLAYSHEGLRCADFVRKLLDDGHQAYGAQSLSEEVYDILVRLVNDGIIEHENKNYCVHNEKELACG